MVENHKETFKWGGKILLNLYRAMLGSFLTCRTVDVATRFVYLRARDFRIYIYIYIFKNISKNTSFAFCGHRFLKRKSFITGKHCTRYFIFNNQ